ncbi:MAG: FHA domain-containing protein [Chitinivibrionales bacterium]|nr:FHA domain-containing protein [Chitinivibrionales bacterium]
MMETALSQPQKFKYQDQTITIGRDSDCDIAVHGVGISRVHAYVLVSRNNVVITDNESSFGLRVNGQKVASRHLKHEDVLVLGVMQFRCECKEQYFRLIPFRAKHETTMARTFAKPAKDTFVIGRDSSNRIQINHPLVSRFHAKYSCNDYGERYIKDLKSTNGTYVNGKRVKLAALVEGDVVQIGPHRLTLVNGELTQTDDSNRIKLEAVNLTVRHRDKLLLNNISLTIHPGEFVAILGPSGAGKTTLARALTGQIAIESGQVLFNGLAMRSFFSAFSSRIGYVAQQNMLHSELTVAESFSEQALLRLPGDNRPEERQSRISEVVELLDLRQVIDNRISRLSGGEAKRVHLGIELLSSPTLIFLDEPLAGLDTGLVRKFMELFRKISEKGHTLLLTTHALEQINLCDRIIFINKGAAIYNGPPAQLAKTFGLESLGQIYETVREQKSNTRLIKQVESSLDTTMQTSRDITEYTAAKYTTDVRLERPKGAAFGKQLGVLVKRYLRILIRDYKNLGLLIIQAPLIASLLVFVFNRDSSFLPLSFYFCVSISAIWIGGMNSVREISRECESFMREYRAGMSSYAYLASKILVFSSLSLLQALFFGFCLSSMFLYFDLRVDYLVLICAATIAGSLLGLCISMLSGNVKRSISWLPIIFIPQIFFSGILIPFDRMSDVGKALSLLTIARPIFSLFKRSCFLDQSVWVWSDWRVLIFQIAGLIILLFLGLFGRCAAKS